MTMSEEAFRKVFERNYRNVLAYALRRTTGAQDAEDVAAETFVTAWRRSDALPASEAEQTLWLYGVARRVLANHRRGAGRAARLSHRLADTAAVAPGLDEGSDDAEVVDALDALRRLKDADRELLTLALWEGLNHAEIARVVGTNSPNVAVRLHRAKRRLRASFDDVRATQRQHGPAPLPHRRTACQEDAS